MLLLVFVLWWFNFLDKLDLPPLLAFSLFYTSLSPSSYAFLTCLPFFTAIFSPFLFPHLTHHFFVDDFHPLIRLLSISEIEYRGRRSCCSRRSLHPLLSSLVTNKLQFIPKKKKKKDSTTIPLCNSSLWTCSSAGFLVEHHSLINQYRSLTLTEF